METVETTRRPARHAAARRPLARLRAHLSTLPNQISAARLVAIPVLWALALTGRASWVGVGTAVAAASDWIDGYLSRKWRQESRFGSRLDSLADHLLTISVVAWLLILRPEFFREQAAPLIAWATFALGVLGVSFLKFHRPVDLHLYSAKVAVTMAYLFVVPLLYSGRYSRLHFYVTLAVCLFAAAEALAVLLTRRSVDERIGSLLLPRRKRR